MNNKLIQMGEIDPHTFLAGVFDGFFSLALNSLVPITIGPYHLQVDEDFQTLQDAFNSLNKAAGYYWSSFLGPISLGQYAARKHINIFAFARNDIIFRRPTFEEVEYDFRYFGEQVMGPELTNDRELHGYETALQFFDKLYIYTGPPRLLSATLTARILSRSGLLGDHELEGFKQEVDNNYGKPENSKLQFYIVFMAEKSHTDSAKIKMLHYQGNGKPDLGKMQFLGTVHAIKEERKLFFYPEDDVSKKIDFSENYWGV